jgi:hypothetical protein
MNEMYGEKILEDPREEDLKSEIEYLNSRRKKWNYLALGLLVLCFLMIFSFFLFWGFTSLMPFVGLFVGLLGVAALAKADEVEKRAATLSARLTEDLTNVRAHAQTIGRLERLRTFLGAMGVLCLIFGLWVFFRDFLLGFILIIGGTLVIVVSHEPRELAMDLLADSTPVDIEKAKWPRQIIAAAIWGVLVGWLEYLFYHSWLPHFVITVWSDFGLFSVSGIWFGAWGILAAYIGNTMGHGSALGFEVSALCSVGTILAVLVPAWAFRRFKGDPRLKTSRDAFLFLLFGAIVPSFISAFITPPIQFLYGFIPNIAALTQIVMPGWFLSNTIYTSIFGFPLLLIFSRILVHIRAYCRGWFS